MTTLSLLTTLPLIASLLTFPSSGVLLCPGDDLDHDGFGTSCDCDDSLPSVYPLAPQICGDGLDNDCLNGDYPFGWPNLFSAGDVDLDLDGVRRCAGDCDDIRWFVRPGLQEVCDGYDNDCDGRTNAPMQPDADGDGFSPNCGDCDDALATVFPGAPQICGDGLNNDCFQAAWPSLSGTNESDDDGDGYTECSGDCADDTASRSPGQSEICNGFDDDCDGRVDAPMSQDNDNDGHSGSCDDCDDHNPAVYGGAPQLCGDGIDNACLPPESPFNETDDDGDGHTECQGDCDDEDASIYPGGPQICDRQNNDCLDPAWPDLPQDEANVDGDQQSVCEGDCSDYDPATYTNRPQFCDGRNNNCADPLWPIVPPEEIDHDGDRRRPCDGDCDENNEHVYAGAPPICDGFNNDCGSSNYPSVIGTNEWDDDGDAWSECSGDCRDTDARVYPGSLQLCDGVNNDCDDPSWPTVASIERDDDGDGRMGCSPIPDCIDTLASAWASPGPARDLGFLDPAYVDWSPPLEPGGTTLFYDLLRSEDPSNFVDGTVCLRSATSASFWEEETAVPAEGAFFSYLVRVRNFCPAVLGNTNMGTDSSGAPRVGRSCP